MVAQVSEFMMVEGKKLYYEVTGEGKPVVFVHAGFLESGMWDGQWDAFAKEYRVIRYDMRGYGKSDPLDAPASRRAELNSLLNHLGIDAAYLVGCSMGGETVLDFAIEQPQRVLGLVIVNSAPGGFEMQGPPPANLMALMEAAQQNDLPRVTELQLRLWIDGPTRSPDEVAAGVRRRAAQMTATSVKYATWAVADMQPADPLTPPAIEQLNKVQSPTLVIAGALDDPEILRAADTMVTGIGGARKVVIPGVAHIPSMEKPEEFNRIVLEFLRSIE